MACFNYNLTNFAKDLGLMLNSIKINQFKNKETKRILETNKDVQQKMSNQFIQILSNSKE